MAAEPGANASLGDLVPATTVSGSSDVGGLQGAQVAGAEEIKQGLGQQFQLPQR